jgi:DNA-directed RNA polymerase subunit RPC12/RpoP
MLNSIAVGSRWAVLTRRACPECGSLRTTRAHRRSMLDDALAALRVNPYRCAHCSTRFFALPFLRSLGEKPWSADTRETSIRQRCSNEPSVFLIMINGLAALSMMY